MKIKTLNLIFLVGGAVFIFISYLITIMSFGGPNANLEMGNKILSTIFFYIPVYLVSLFLSRLFDKLNKHRLAVCISFLPILSVAYWFYLIVQALPVK